MDKANEYMEVIARMLVTTVGFDFNEWQERFNENSDDWANDVWFSGAVKYWEKNMFNDFLVHLKQESGLVEDPFDIPPGHGYIDETGLTEDAWIKGEF